MIMKRLLALVLSMLLMVSLVLGCGNDKKQAEAKPATTTTQTKTQSTVDNNKANSNKISISESATYTDKVHVAAYIHQFKKLPKNYITKANAEKLGWQSKGTLDKVAPGKSIGGDRYGNYEGKLPKQNGRSYKECDIDYVKGSRNAKRIVFSNDGLIFYTGDHYKTFEKLY